MQRIIASVLTLAALAGATGTARAQAHDEKKEHENQAAMKKEARISPEQAKQAALQARPGAHVKSVELEREQGQVLYEVRLTPSGGKHVEEVHVSAATGEVVPVEESEERKP